MSPADDIDIAILKQLQDLDKVDVAPDEDDLYARSVAEQLKKLTPKARGMAKMKIQQVLYEVQFCTPEAQNYSVDDLETY